MKVNPRTDYPVRVRPLSMEVEPSVAALYAGGYEVAFNYMVTFSFVPDLGTTAPAYDRALLPENLDEVATPEQARLEAVLFAEYAITPNDRLAGTNERLPAPPWADGWPGGVVSYVRAEQFARFAIDLEALVPDLCALYSDTPISRLGGHPALDFAVRLTAEPWFTDGSWLRDEA
jgi:hypothetical protein